jgi:hypothetical protein
MTSGELFLASVIFICNLQGNISERKNFWPVNVNRKNCKKYTVKPMWPSKGTMVGFGFIVFSTTFNNISVILWRSVLLVEETGGPAENHRPAASHWQTLLHNVVSSTPRTDCTGSYKSNYHTITTTTFPLFIKWIMLRLSVYRNWKPCSEVPSQYCYWWRSSLYRRQLEVNTNRKEQICGNYLLNFTFIMIIKVNCDREQFYQYQISRQLPLISNQWI